MYVPRGHFLSVAKLSAKIIILRALAIGSAIGSLTVYIVYRASSTPTESIRTRISSSKSQRVLTTYRATREAEKRSGDASSAMPGSKSRMVLHPSDLSGLFSPPEPSVTIDDKPVDLFAEPAPLHDRNPAI